jgi:hypothetical protein
MFEGKPPVPARAPGDSAAPEGEGELHAVSWSELVARLSAARELRTVLVADALATPASFDADSARRLATMPVGEAAAANGNKPVNLDGSANRKCPHGTNRSDEQQRRPALRGNP